MKDVVKPKNRQEILIEVYIQYLRQEISMGELLITLRKKILSMSQDEFAALVGVSRKTLSNLELNKAQPSETIINKVFKPLGLKSGLVPTHQHVVTKIFTTEDNSNQ